MARVFAAMSGGVDSSTAAALLVEAGHDVVGVTMRLLDPRDADTACSAMSAAEAARAVCDALGIPHRTVDLREEFRAEVVVPFVRAYAGGRTPNPCVTCNERMKSALLWARVAAEGAEALATGHYARIVRRPDGEAWLARGADTAKDQSYFLYRLGQAELAHTLFPLGDVTKPAVRAMARERGLPAADTPESQEVCFVADGQVSAFVSAEEPGAARPGPIVDVAGRVLGTHKGIAFYTVGQRRGLGVAAPEPLYVLAIDAATGTVVVGSSAELEVSEVVCGDVVWRGGEEQRVGVQVRYRQRPVPATARIVGSRLLLALDEPVSGVAPGQAAVCYNEDEVVGGGVVEETR